MNKPHFDIPKLSGTVTFFLFEDCAHMLCRSADWYRLKPVERYLCNMAASVIRMEDARTETREYTLEAFQLLGDLVKLSIHSPDQATWRAWLRWHHPELAFGVVHLDQTETHRGDLILGDSPDHVWEFQGADFSETVAERERALVVTDQGRQGFEASSSSTKMPSTAQMLLEEKTRRGGAIIAGAAEALMPSHGVEGSDV